MSGRDQRRELRAPAVAVFLILLLMTAPAPVAGAQESGSVTRGRSFTVTVIGDLRTPYVVWVSGTSEMSGEPGDQPPVIAPGQTDVTTDPPEGPYPIGSTPIGGGRTVLEDVARSYPGVPNTSYYAQVRTGIDGGGVVLFLTSRATAARQFHVRAVDPAHPDREVTVILRVPEPALVPTAETPRTPTPLPSSTPVITVPPGDILVVPATPESPIVLPVTLSAGTSSGTVPPVQSTPETPLAASTAGIALGMAFLTMARLRWRRD